MYYVIFIDIDGTLLNDKRQISNRVKNIIHNILELGHKIVLCTGRSRASAIKIAKEVGTSTYIITSNGAEIYDFKNNKVIYSSVISDKVITRVIKEISKINAKITMSIDNLEYIIGNKYNQFQEYLPDDYINFFKFNLPKQAMIIGDEKKLQILRDIIVHYDDIEINSKKNIHEEQGLWFSIINRGISKGKGVREFCNFFDIPRDRIISIGNDYNDIEMFDESKISIAVSNATEEIKNKANIITESNNNDGVAKVLEKLYISIL